MDTLFIDFETYYDTQYSLSKMTTPQYIKDDRFKVHCCSVALNDEPAHLLRGHEACQTFFDAIDWKNTRVVAHNLRFDGAISGWVFKHYAARYTDTLGMARYFIPGAVSLKMVAKKLGLKDKLDGLEQTKGVRDIPDEMWESFEAYANNDVELSREIYNILMPHFPEREEILLDITMRMFIQPKIMVDKDLLTQYISTLQDELAGLTRDTLNEVSSWASEMGWDIVVDEKLFTSNKRFIELLNLLEVEVPYKYRAATATEVKKGLARPGQQVKVPALAKGDAMFVDLMSRYEGSAYQQVFDLRMALKSRIEETRATRFNAISDVMDGWLPTPLNYFGAKTGRWSGADKVNLQNLSSRGNTKVLRQSLIAPPGYVYVVSDLAQIEPRVLATLAGATDLVEAFRSGKDFYSALYGRTFGVDYDELYEGYKRGEKKYVDMRNVGKGMGLGLGYGMGAPKFIAFAKTTAGRTFSEMESKQVVRRYRDGNPEIVNFWGNCDRMLFPMAGGKTMEATHFNGVWAVNDPMPAIILPSGNYLKYPNLRGVYSSRTSPTPDGYEFGIDGTYSGIYGGLMVENIVQALSRDILGDMIVRLAGLMEPDEGFANLVHDEVVILVREERAEYIGEKVVEQMRIAPDWFPDVPLNCSMNIARNYAEAK
jgi:DNA polymerase